MSRWTRKNQHTNPTNRRRLNFERMEDRRLMVSDINVVGNLLTIADGDATPSINDDTDFGAVNVTGGIVSRTFTIQNTGNTDLTLTNPTFTGAGAGDFSLTGVPALTVTAGNFTNFVVSFDPSVAGLRTALITIDNNDPDAEDPYTFAIEGTGQAGTPEINLQGNGLSIADDDTTPSLADFTDFDATNVTGGMVSRTFTIQNTGTAVLTLSNPTFSGVAAGDFSLTGFPLTSIPAGGFTNFVVTFDPSAAGVRAATLSITNNDANETTYNFDIQGTGIAGGVSAIAIEGNGQAIVDADATPDLVDFTDFGSANVTNGSVSRTFTIRNTGTAPLILNGSPSFTGVGAGDFSLTGFPALNIPVGSFTTFTVKFDPSAAGLRAAEIVITSNDPNIGTFNFGIQGTGTATQPEIDIQGNGLSIVDGETTTSSNNFTLFGTVAVAAGSISRTFTILNTGTTTLNLTGVPQLSGTNPGDFTVTGFPPATIAPGGIAHLVISFDPTAAGSRTAVVSIANDDADENPYTFAIEGNGVLVATPIVAVQGNGVAIVDGDTTPSLTDHTDFGSTDVAVGTISRTFTITNTGSAPLTLANPTVTGANAADFTVTTPITSPVAVGGSTQFTVTFNPSAGGLRIAEISFTSDDPASPFNFTVQGTGVNSVLPFTQDFEIDSSGMTVNQGTFTRTSNGVDYDFIGAPAAAGPNQVAVATADISSNLSGVLDVRATLATTPKSGEANYSNGFIIFDYKSPTDFKVAGLLDFLDRWVIGRFTTNGYQELASFKEVASATGTPVGLRVILSGRTATLSADTGAGFVQKETYTFPTGPNGETTFTGRIGVGTINSRALFDNFSIAQA